MRETLDIPLMRSVRLFGLAGRLAVAAVALVLALPIHAETAAEWSQFRGPDRDGQAPMLQVPSPWPDAPTELWKVEIGMGHASPVVSDGRIYIMTRRLQDEVAMALDLKDGSTVWEKTYPTQYMPHQAAVKFGRGPRATPVVAEGVVCFTGVDARFTCHDAKDGKELWQRDFSESSDIAETFCGASLTPLIENGVIYMHLGDDRAGRLFAADLRTGEEIWAYDGQGPGYASPLMLDIDGTRQLIVFATIDLLGFDPADGRLLWKRPYLDKWRENIPTPLVVGKRIVIADYVNGTLSLWPKKTDKGWRVEDHWQNKELTQRMSSPVTDGERIYGFSDKKKGQLFVADPATGEVIWSDVGRGGQNAVLTLAGKWLLVSSTTGELKVATWEKDALNVVKTYEIADSEVWAQPAWLTDGMLIKDLKHLTRYSWDAPAEAAPSGDKAEPAAAKNGR